jgi:hypothetical protein
MFIARRFLPWRWRRHFPAKRRFLKEPYGETSQKTPFFIVTAVKTSNLTSKDIVLLRVVALEKFNSPYMAWFEELLLQNVLFYLYFDISGSCKACSMKRHDFKFQFCSTYCIRVHWAVEKYVGSEVFTAVTMKNAVFWDIATQSVPHREHVSAREPSRLMLCKICGFHGGNYEECRLLGYSNPVRTSQGTYTSATESSRLMLCNIWGFHGGDHEECNTA